VPETAARKIILWFARNVVPATLSRIAVQVGETRCNGYLLTSARTPSLLLSESAGETRRHLADLFLLATRKGVRRVGLGALLPSLTGYGRRFAAKSPVDRPAVSTGHAYTAHNGVSQVPGFKEEQSGRGSCRNRLCCWLDRQSRGADACACMERNARVPGLEYRPSTQQRGQDYREPNKFNADM
jgi:hypothetical protein